MENGSNGSAEAQKPKWYFRTGFIVVALLSVGPFALPLLWFNRRYTLVNKVLWTVIVCAISYALVLVTVETGGKVIQQYRDLGLIQ